MENEKLVLCDCKSYKNDKNQVFYYLVIYSSFEYLEKVFVTQQDFEFVVKNQQNIHIKDFLTRSFNRKKQMICFRFVRK